MDSSAHPERPPVHPERSHGVLARLLRRLPFLIVLAVGVWLWKGGGGFPTTREIIWELGSDRASIRELDIQIADAKGTLIKRDQFFFREAPPAQVTQKARLARGDYPTRVFIKRAEKAAEDQFTTVVRLGDEEATVVPIAR